MIALYQRVINSVFSRLRQSDMQAAGETTGGTRRRVKVYQLNDDRQWDDRGTGHVTAQTGPDDVVSLLVRSEVDNSILLDSEIRQDTNYSKVSSKGLVSLLFTNSSNKKRSLSGARIKTTWLCPSKSDRDARKFGNASANARGAIQTKLIRCNRQMRSQKMTWNCPRRKSEI